jgi:hypothetical protein
MFLETFKNMSKLREEKTAIFHMFPGAQFFIGLDCLSTCVRQAKLKIIDGYTPGDMAIQLASIESTLINDYLDSVYGYPGILRDINIFIINTLEEKLKQADFNKVGDDGVHNKFIMPAEFSELEVLYVNELLVKYYSRYSLYTIEDAGIVCPAFVR